MLALQVYAVICFIYLEKTVFVDLITYSVHEKEFLQRLEKIFKPVAAQLRQLENPPTEEGEEFIEMDPS